MGIVRPAVVVYGRAAGRRLEIKKCKHGCLYFFIPLGPGHGPGAVPPPLSR
ncbi:hypothetical protein TREAZ_1952 [Leadbettera azotonutricia ZAS-9]|uniref:Uncharacterized protein n=1 Tax=Leadbettera azotonutricia (strain ATCC BAA-888 / DSM 13862 / ZAS-9) TaxID=545695 RepID=F5YAQ2_LEAAZ|nr:hypothetical protein TREAZ_1952 [Leadbettera azotonutricia ZAS-9]